MGNDRATNQRELSGVLGFFEDPHAMVDAARKVREAGYDAFDTFTPFPIHGMDDAMGLKRSPIPYVTFLAGLTGFTLAFTLEYWTSAIDWPLNIGGKPLNSWPAFVPIMFELTVLLAGLSTVAAMFAFNRLPNVKYKAFDPAITRDKFALLIGASSKGKSFNESEASQFLKQLGAREVKTVFAEGWF